MKVRDYGLTLVLAGLFLVSWVFQGLFEFRDAGEAFWSWAFWNAFLAATFENWQSEFLQLFSFVVLSTFLIHRGSPQSRDGDDDMKRELAEVKALVERLVERDA